MQAPTIVEHTVDLDNEDGPEDTQTPFHDHSHPPSHPNGTQTSPSSNIHLGAPPVPHLHQRPGPNGHLNGDIPGVPSSRVHTRSASMATIPSLPPGIAGPTIPHSQTTPSLSQRVSNRRKHNRRAPSLQLHNATRLGIEGAVQHSPMTPSYRFGVDEHFASQQHTHLHVHTPNLHDHSHVHGSGQSREGHSHNMRGLFLHVMAVSSFPSPLSLFAFVWLTEVAPVRPLIGHAGLGRCDRVDATHTILWLDGFRPNSVDFHRGSHRSERDPARH
jgi:solute carrier family 30 (zinc transporter), member 5/7